MNALFPPKPTEVNCGFSPFPAPLDALANGQVRLSTEVRIQIKRGPDGQPLNLTEFPYVREGITESESREREPLIFNGDTRFDDDVIAIAWGIYDVDQRPDLSAGALVFRRRVWFVRRDDPVDPPPTDAVDPKTIVAGEVTKPYTVKGQ